MQVDCEGVALLEAGGLELILDLATGARDLQELSLYKLSLGLAADDS